MVGAIEIEVQAHALAPLRGVFFDLIYPPDLVAYVGLVPGSFLGVSSIGQPNRIPGRLRCHLAVAFSPNVPPVSGSGTMLRLYFAPRAPGQGLLRFEGQGIYDPDTGRQRWNERRWFGGTVTVAH